MWSCFTTFEYTLAGELESVTGREKGGKKGSGVFEGRHVHPGQQVTGSTDGRWLQVREVEYDYDLFDRLITPDAVKGTQLKSIAKVLLANALG